LSSLLTTSVFPAAVFRLDNGLTIIHQYVPATSVVVVDVWVRAGAMYEPEPCYGMAHFLEHMIFKGTSVIPPGVFDYAIENLGGTTNATTSHDYAHFFLTTAVPYLEDTLPYLAELLLNAAIPEEEFIRERDVVLEEIRCAYDDPDWIGFQALGESIYQQHPYGRSVLGSETDLMQHSPEAMRCFHHAHYQPENMTIVVVGGIAQEPAIDIVSKAFQTFAPRSECPYEIAIAEPLLAGVRRQEIYLPRLEQARLLMAWTGPGVDQLRNAYGLDLISVLLSEGRSSRLVRELREEQHLVQGITSNFSLQRDSSLFTITAWLEPENLEQVESLIRTHLEDLQINPVTSGELARCKRLLCNDYAFSTETPNQMAGLYGYYNTIAQAELAVIYPEQIRSFQADEIQQLTQQYLSPYSYAVTALKPC
jgi:predicted Zn-dependent peptidase